MKDADYTIGDNQGSKDCNAQEAPQDELHGRTARHRTTTSTYRGVCWHRKSRRWQSAINSSGRHVYLGSFDTEEEAARMFDMVAIRVRGSRAKINFAYKDYLRPDGQLRSDPRVEQLAAEARKAMLEKQRSQEGYSGDEAPESYQSAAVKRRRLAVAGGPSSGGGASLGLVGTAASGEGEPPALDLLGLAQAQQTQQQGPHAGAGAAPAGGFVRAGIHGLQGLTGGGAGPGAGSPEVPDMTLRLGLDLLAVAAAQPSVIGGSGSSMLAARGGGVGQELGPGELPGLLGRGPGGPRDGPVSFSTGGGGWKLEKADVALSDLAALLQSQQQQQWQQLQLQDILQQQQQQQQQQQLQQDQVLQAYVLRDLEATAALLPQQHPPQQQNSAGVLEELLRREASAAIRTTHGSVAAAAPATMGGGARDPVAGIALSSPPDSIGGVLQLVSRGSIPAVGAAATSAIGRDMTTALYRRSASAAGFESDSGSGFGSRFDGGVPAGDAPGIMSVVVSDANRVDAVGGGGGGGGERRHADGDSAEAAVASLQHFLRMSYSQPQLPAGAHAPPLQLQPGGGLRGDGDSAPVAVLLGPLSRLAAILPGARRPTAAAGLAAVAPAGAGGGGGDGGGLAATTFIDAAGRFDSRLTPDELRSALATPAAADRSFDSGIGGPPSFLHLGPRADSPRARVGVRSATGPGPAGPAAASAAGAEGNTLRLIVTARPAAAAAAPLERSSAAGPLDMQLNGGQPGHPNLGRAGAPNPRGVPAPDSVAPGPAPAYSVAGPQSARARRRGLPLVADVSARDTGGGGGGGGSGGGGGGGSGGGLLARLSRFLAGVFPHLPPHSSVSTVIPSADENLLGYTYAPTPATAAAGAAAPLAGADQTASVPDGAHRPRGAEELFTKRARLGSRDESVGDEGATGAGGHGAGAVVAPAEEATAREARGVDTNGGGRTSSDRFAAAHGALDQFRPVHSDSGSGGGVGNSDGATGCCSSGRAAPGAALPLQTSLGRREPAPLGGFPRGGAGAGVFFRGQYRDLGVYSSSADATRACQACMAVLLDFSGVLVPGAALLSAVATAAPAATTATHSGCEPTTGAPAMGGLVLHLEEGDAALKAAAGIGASPTARLGDLVDSQTWANGRRAGAAAAVPIAGTSWRRSADVDGPPHPPTTGPNITAAVTTAGVSGVGASAGPDATDAASVRASLAHTLSLNEHPRPQHSDTQQLHLGLRQQLRELLPEGGDGEVPAARMPVLAGPGGVVRLVAVEGGDSNPDPVADEEVRPVDMLAQLLAILRQQHQEQQQALHHHQPSQHGTLPPQPPQPPRSQSGLLSLDRPESRQPSGRYHQNQPRPQPQPQPQPQSREGEPHQHNHHHSQQPQHKQAAGQEVRRASAGSEKLPFEQLGVLMQQLLTKGGGALAAPARGLLEPQPQSQPHSRLQAQGASSLPHPWSCCEQLASELKLCRQSSLCDGGAGADDDGSQLVLLTRRASGPLGPFAAAAWSGLSSAAPLVGHCGLRFSPPDATASPLQRQMQQQQQERWQQQMQQELLHLRLLQQLLLDRMRGDGGGCPCGPGPSQEQEQQQQQQQLVEGRVLGMSVCRRPQPAADRVSAAEASPSSSTSSGVAVTTIGPTIGQI